MKKIHQQQSTINNMNNTMLDTLSTVIEYRDVESGKHVHRIRKFTEIFCVLLLKDARNIILLKAKLIL